MDGRHAKLLRRLEREEERYALMVAVCVTDDGRVVVVPSEGTGSKTHSGLVALGALGVAHTALSQQTKRKPTGASS